MALKDNLKSIKKDLSIEEQMIENFIRSEKFIKKYKYFFLFIVVFALSWFSYTYVSEILRERNNEEANKIYTNLTNNPNDTAGLDLLKTKNINLYALFLFSHSEILKDFGQRMQELSTAKVNPLLKDILTLDLGRDSKFLKNYTRLLQAYELLKTNKIEEADVLLSQISSQSEFKQQAENLKHYKGIK